MNIRNIRRLVQAASITAVAILMVAARANAATVTFNTNSGATGFAGGGLTLNNVAGQAATLSFTGDANTTASTTSNISFGSFSILCPLCSTAALGGGAVFGAFTFNLVVTDVTDGAVGRFVGTSSGGVAFSDLSQLTIHFSPLQLGPGANNATSGNFGATVFTTASVTDLAAVNATATVAGVVSSATPEPVTLGLLGSGLLGLGVLRRKMFIRHRGGADSHAPSE